MQAPELLIHAPALGLEMRASALELEMHAPARASYFGAGHLNSGSYAHSTLQLSHLHTAYSSFLTPQKIGACVFVAPPHHHIGVTARAISVPPSLLSWVKCVFRFGTKGASSSRGAISVLATGMSAGLSSISYPPLVQLPDLSSSSSVRCHGPRDTVHEDHMITGTEIPIKNKIKPTPYCTCLMFARVLANTICLSPASRTVALFLYLNSDGQRWDILLAGINYIFINLCFVPVLDLQNIVMNTMWADI